MAKIRSPLAVARLDMERNEDVGGVILHFVGHSGFVEAPGIELNQMGFSYMLANDIPALDGAGEPGGSFHWGEADVKMHNFQYFSVISRRRDDTERARSGTEDQPRDFPPFPAI